MTELAQVLRPLLHSTDPNALVDASTGDDAAVYLLDGDGGRALVVSLDFFTPMLDDAFDFGRVAAANALSDLYAMGARPLFALNLLGFPRELLSEGIVEQVIEGGQAVAIEAGIPILGGHSIDDPEPKYGMVVVGEAQRSELVTNSGAQPGDLLVLTKALGTGVVTTALKNDAVDPTVLTAAVARMTTLNARSAQAMTRVGVNAATDVTGFGLLGHLRAMLRASRCGADIDSDRVPLLPGARSLAGAGQIPGGTRRNLDDLAPDVAFDESVAEVLRLLLCDAQTSGGLLISVSPERCDRLMAELAPHADDARIIGTIVEAPAGRISVTPGALGDPGT